MQFHVVRPAAEDHGRANGPADVATSTRGGSARGLELPPQPGRVRALKAQQQQLQRHQEQGSPVPSRSHVAPARGSLSLGDGRGSGNQSTHQRPAGGGAGPRKAVMAAEGVNYLRLRRTEDSKRALGRNRTAAATTTTAQEIIRPTTPTKPKQSEIVTTLDAIVREKLVAQVTEVAQMDRVLQELRQKMFAQRPAVPTKTDDAAAFAVNLQILYRTQQKIHKESHAAAERVQELLTVVRNDISLMYKFTPLFKIYSHHKCKSGWQRWHQYVLWHREEMARLQLLWPYAVKIQHTFRRKRSRWNRARARLEHAWDQWRAAVQIQRTMRVWLARQERRRREEAVHATRMQAAWRGRRDRKFVKKYLQDTLRWMLRTLSPTGNLHRLHEVIRNDPSLAVPLNEMLTLVEETLVSVDTDTVYHARNARIAARIAARPVEATRKRLFHAVCELNGVITRRQVEVGEGKRDYNSRRIAKQKMLEEAEFQRRTYQYLVIKEKLIMKKEAENMRKEELQTREYLRMLRTIDADRTLHLKLDEMRRQEAENARMIVEEYQMRYYVSEKRRREQDDESRRREVEKRQRFLDEQERDHMNQLLDMLKTDEMKRQEAESKRLTQKINDAEQWQKLSKDQQQEALRRLQLKEELQQEELKRSEAIARRNEEERLRVARLREESRQRKQEELDRELCARENMEAEEKRCKKVHFELKKAAHAQIWQSRREKELTRYSLDPMHFAKVQTQKEVEERERRERYLMKKEDELSLAIHKKERKEVYFQECRKRARERKEELSRAQNESNQMAVEDSTARGIEVAGRRARQFEQTKKEMEMLSKSAQAKELERVFEAKMRTSMFEEEMRQRRVQQTVYARDCLRERYERESMTHEDTISRIFRERLSKKEDKKIREKRMFQMMKEDVASMTLQDWQEEGSLLEGLLWSPVDAAAFRHLVKEHPDMLIENVEIFKTICQWNGPPPFDLDYQAVHLNSKQEAALTPESVPRRKRKPKKFFYHEFFEDDPILSKPKPPPTPPTRARQRWRMLAEHFFGKLWSSDAHRVGQASMANGNYIDASKALLQAVRLSESSASRQTSAALLRQLARCYHKLWNDTFQRDWIEKSLHYYQKSSAHVVLLGNPRFLHEIASVLEDIGFYREAAQVCAGIISCFPRYPRLQQVIFRSGIILFSLQMYQQSREYILHTLDAPPGGWQQFEVLFLAARIMQFEGKQRRKLCSVAYEEAFRANKRDAFFRTYPNWNEWLKATDTWRKVGDSYFAKREFVLARDAYEMMIKRQQKKPLHMMNKRQAVMEARNATRKSEIMRNHEDSDWLRLARVQSILNDREGASKSLKQWFSLKSYRERIEQQYHSWPLARWKLLGVEIPQSVIDTRNERAAAKEEAEHQRRREQQLKQQAILRERNMKVRARILAWDETSVDSQKGITDSDPQVIPQDLTP